MMHHAPKLKCLGDFDLLCVGDGQGVGLVCGEETLLEFKNLIMLIIIIIINTADFIGLH